MATDGRWLWAAGTFLFAHITIYPVVRRSAQCRRKSPSRSLVLCLDPSALAIIFFLIPHHQCPVSLNWLRPSLPSPVLWIWQWREGEGNETGSILHSQALGIRLSLAPALLKLIWVWALQSNGRIQRHAARKKGVQFTNDGVKWVRAGPAEQRSFCSLRTLFPVGKAPSCVQGI